MTDLGWRADGIERAEAAGGITLERYRKIGFTAGIGVRKRPGDAHASGFIVDDPELWEYDDEDRKRRARHS